MVSKKILITRPRYEDTTHYLCAWNQDVVQLAEDKGFIVHDLDGSKATQKNLESYLGKKSYDFVCFNGHGSPTCIYGHDDQILIEKVKPK